MFNALWEFLFCPIHGIFRPEMWPLVVIVLAHARLYWKQLWKKKGCTNESTNESS